MTRNYIWFKLSFGRNDESRLAEAAFAAPDIARGFTPHHGAHDGRTCR